MRRGGGRKAVGNGVVRGEHPLKGEKYGGVSVRGRCALDCVVSLKKSMKKFHKRAVKGTMLRSILKYPTFAMEWNLALALVKCWVSRSMVFRLAGRLVPFFVFDVALLTRLLGTREMESFDDDGMTDFGEMVRLTVLEEEEEELGKRKVQSRSRDNRVYKNCVAAMAYLLERNAGEEQLDL